MSTMTSSSRRTPRTRPAWSGVALVIEAMLVLLFVAASLAILTQLFASATVRAEQGRLLAEAVSVATNEAERFAANPEDAAGTTEEGDLVVRCEVSERETGAGTLYDATITVYQADGREPIYVLETSRYEGGER